MSTASSGNGYLIISDNLAFRQRLRQALASRLDGECILADACLVNAAALAQRMQPAMVLLTMARAAPHMLPGDLLHACPSARYLLFAPCWSDTDMTRALLDGAHGCLALDTPEEDWLTALRAIESGHYWVTPEAMARAFEQLQHQATRQGAGNLTWLDELTGREREVTEAAMRGLDNKEIARELGISIATVKTHLHHVFSKLGMTRRALLLHADDAATPRSDARDRPPLKPWPR